MSASKPLYTLTADTIEELSLLFAEAVMATERIEVVEKEKTKFAAWKLDDGTSESFYKSLTLTPAQAKTLSTKEGAPLKLAIDMRFLNLTPVDDVAKAITTTKAATIKRIESRLNEAESLRAKLERLRGKA